MARVSVEQLSKRFGATDVLRRIDLDVRDGEFLAVLGPSGCGKTTLLRLVAGFEKADEGRIAIGGRAMSGPGLHVPPEKRDVGIVFQSYALWPHMNVAENVGYSLRVRRVAQREIDAKVKDALATVGLEGFGARAPGELSGGQRQRVALARCLVQAPKLVLLDEPLANLDVHLRAAMEDEFADFHARSGATMVYITHDQSEAMALADRIAVMDAGRIVQCAAPHEIYNRPANAMVAGFIGGGLVLDATYRGADGDAARVDLFGASFRLRAAGPRRPGERVQIAVYPSALALTTESDGLACRVTRRVYQGGRYKIEMAPEASPHTQLVMDTSEQAAPEVGARIHVRLTDGWLIPEAAA